MGMGWVYGRNEAGAWSGGFLFLRAWLELGKAFVLKTDRLTERVVFAGKPSGGVAFFAEERGWQGRDPFSA